MQKYKYVPLAIRERISALLEHEIGLKTGIVPENLFEAVDAIYSFGKKEVDKFEKEIEKEWGCTFADLLYSAIVDILMEKGMSFENASKRAEKEMDELHRLMKEARELYVNSERKEDEQRRRSFQEQAKNIIHNAELAPDLCTVKKTFVHCNILDLEVGTNTPKGGDAGHGGLTLFKLIDGGGTDWRIRITDDSGSEHYFEMPQEITIVLGGDAEAKTFSEALLFAGKYLKLRMKGEI